MIHAAPPAAGTAGFSQSCAGQFFNTSEGLLFASADLEEARSLVSRVMKPHALHQTRARERLNARMHHVALGELSLSRLRYGATVQIDPGALESFFLVQMPLAGNASITSGSQSVQSDCDMATVLSPLEANRMCWHSGNDQVMLRISRTLLERMLAGHLGRRLEQPLRFELGFRWRESVAWRNLLAYLMDCARHAPDWLHHKLALTQLEQLAASILLTTHTHNYSEIPPPRRAAILPRHVRRAQEYAKNHAHEPLTIAQIAHEAGVSERSLYAGFKEFLGTSPMHYLRDVRMDNVRNELASGLADTVSSVALRWGFAHMGRFSREYKKRYGQTPSETLRASGA